MVRMITKTLFITCLLLGLLSIKVDAGILLLQKFTFVIEGEEDKTNNNNAKASNNNQRAQSGTNKFTGTSRSDSAPVKTNTNTNSTNNRPSVANTIRNMGGNNTATNKTPNTQKPPSNTANNNNNNRNNNTANNVTATPAIPVASTLSEGVEKATYLTDEEKEMVHEINLMRSNPKAYIKYIDKYVERNKNGFFSEQDLNNAANELKAELKQLKSLSVVVPHRGVYDAAVRHGLDIKQRGKGGHIGSDGSSPFDRIREAAPGIADCNENIAAGPSSVRDVVIMLLLDIGIPNRGHRRTLLNPAWRYVGTYNVGEVSPFPNYWVQTFGGEIKTAGQ